MIPGLYPLGTLPPGVLDPADFGISGTITIYLASHDYVSLPDDTAPDRYYAGRLTALRLRRTAQRGGGLGGARAFTDGELSLANPDGGLDDYFLSGAVDGRSIRILGLERSSPPGSESLDDATVLFAGIMTRPEVDSRTVRIPLRCRGATLEQPLQGTRFAGSGGAEGGEDLADRPKPAALGRCFGVTPVYLGLISAKHSYMVSGGDFLPIADVPAFYDRGVALTRVTSAPSSGQYAVDTATGIITIGGTVPTLPTCDVDGWKPAGSWLSRTADIWLGLVETIAGETAIDMASVDNMNTDQPAVVGLWIGAEERTLGGTIDALLAGVTALAGCNRRGVHHIDQLKAPEGVIRAQFDDTNTTQISRLPLSDIVDPAPWRVAVTWGRNGTPTSDVASAATEAQRSFMALAERLATAEDSTLQTNRPLSKPWTAPGLFAEQADAAAEAARLLALLSGRTLWRLRSSNIADELDVGDLVELTFPRFGLIGQRGTIVEWAFDLAAARLDPVVFL